MSETRAAASETRVPRAALSWLDALGGISGLAQSLVAAATGPAPVRAAPDLPGVVPPAGPLPPALFLYHFLRNPLRCMPASVYREPIVFAETGGAPSAWVTDPDLVEEVFLGRHEVFPKPPLELRVFRSPLGQSILTDQGADWRWQRKAVAPLFAPRNLDALVPRMAKPAAALAQRLGSGGIRHGHRIDLDVTEATYEAISDTLFGAGAMPESGTIRDAVSTYLNATPWEIVSTLMGRPADAWHPGKPDLDRASAAMRGAITALLARWRAAGSPEGVHLFSLLSAAERDGAPMSEQQLLNNLITFLNAGHETTAKAITWALYLMARFPRWQQAVRDEVREVVGDGPIEAAHVEQLVVTRQVIEESMRLYAPAPVLTRLALETSVIGGHTIPAGTLLFVPIWAIHRHERLWEAPERFDPMRFAPDRRASYRRTQYMPFGHGPRICIGAAFAMMEAAVMIAELVRGLMFAWNGREMPEPLSRVTLWPRGGLRLDIVPVRYARRSSERGQAVALPPEGRPPDDRPSL